LSQLVEETLKQRFKNSDDNVYMKELVTDYGNYMISDMRDMVDPETQTPIEIKYQTSLQKGHTNTTFFK